MSAANDYLTPIHPDSDGRLTVYFSDSEFRRASKEPMRLILLQNLQHLRELMGCPLYISSGIRTYEENEACGGSKFSQHLYGLAVDIHTANWSAAKKFKLLKLAFELGFKGIAQGKDFIHLDMRPGPPSTWAY